MKKPAREITVRAFASFAEIEPLWAEVDGLDDAPFLRPAWLRALEETGCASEQRGWIPHHLAFFEGDALLAVAPAYLKTNSEGEFIFDWAWANAARKFGVEYYPKLLVAVPFTPATSPRILVARGRDPEPSRAAFAAAFEAIVERAELSSGHALFVTRDEADALERFGLVRRASVQHHWHNRGYQAFEDFLKSVPSKRRTQIRRERREVRERGIEIETVTGGALTREIAAVAYRFYRATVDKFYWGRRYLNRAFFERVCATMPDAIEVVLAKRGGEPIAGAFNLRGARSIFGRYWGADEEVPMLHFEVCYYHSIERCIALGLERFEPGAGGEHKAARGFDPTLTHSVHWLRSPRFRAAIQDFCSRERELLEAEIGGAAGGA